MYYRIKFLVRMMKMLLLLMILVQSDSFADSCACLCDISFTFYRPLERSKDTHLYLQLMVQEVLSWHSHYHQSRQ